MRTYPLLAALTLLLLGALVPAAPAHADGDSPLGALSREVTDLVERADANVAWLTAGETKVPGVLVGKPALFVVAAQPLPTEGLGKVRFADGSEEDAFRLDGDPDLGIAVYGIAQEREGLLVAPSWPVARGTVAVAAGGRAPTFVVLPGTNALRDDFAVEAPADATLLVGPQGRLVGLRRADPLAPVILTGAPTRPEFLGTLMRYHVHSGDGSNVLTGDVSKWNGTSVFKVGDVGDVGPTRWVPGPVIARALEDIASGQKFRRAYLGVVPQETGPRQDAYVRYAWGWSQVGVPGEPRGAKILTVLPGSPAATAGLEAGTTVIAVDGEDCPDSRSFVRALARRRPGETVTLTVRNWAKDVVVTLGALDEARKELRTVADLGLECVRLGEDLRRYLGVSDTVEGLAVRIVTPAGAAEKAGLRQGDVILRGAGGPIRDLEELDAVLAAAEGSLRLSILRAGAQIEIEIPLPPGSVGRKAR